MELTTTKRGWKPTRAGEGTTLPLSNLLLHDEVRPENAAPHRGGDEAFSCDLLVCTKYNSSTINQNRKQRFNAPCTVTVRAGWDGGLPSGAGSRRRAWVHKQNMTSRTPSEGTWFSPLAEKLISPPREKRRPRLFSCGRRWDSHPFCPFRATFRTIEPFPLVSGKAPTPTIPGHRARARRTREHPCK